MTTPKSKKPRPRKSDVLANAGILSLHGKYKGKGLLKALAKEKKRERGFDYGREAITRHHSLDWRNTESR